MVLSSTQTVTGAKTFGSGLLIATAPALTGTVTGTFTLPATAITVFFRSDQSGTTQNFETYLKTAAPADYTATPSKVWSGTVGQGKSGSQGVQQGLQSTDGGIAYLEWSFSAGQGIVNAKVDNGGGAVALTAQTAGAAVAAATIVGTGTDLTLKLDYATKVAGA